MRGSGERRAPLWHACGGGQCASDQVPERGRWRPRWMAALLLAVNTAPPPHACRHWVLAAPACNSRPRHAASPLTSGGPKYCLAACHPWWGTDAASRLRQREQEVKQLQRLMSSVSPRSMRSASVRIASPAAEDGGCCACLLRWPPSLYACRARCTWVLLHWTGVTTTTLHMSRRLTHCEPLRRTHPSSNMWCRSGQEP